MRIIDLLLLIAGAVCFGLAAFGVTTRVNLIAAGLLAWILVPLLAALVAVLGTA